MIKVHITDDHKMFVEGLSDYINKSGIATVTGVSHTLAGCRNALAFHSPDVLLLDINLPDGSGIDFCSEIKQKYDSIKVLALTTRDEYSTVRRMLDKGASGYILKNSLMEEVIAGIEAVVNNEIFLCDEMDKLMKKQINETVWLTAREEEILQYIVNGFTNQEIAEQLCLALETIKTYRKNLISKLGAKNSMILVKMAIEKKLI
jgi:DNA-binding NarL/FixJ family response regulator